MEITIQQITEHEDGSATLIIDMDNETRDCLINYAFVEMLKKGLEETKRLREGISDVNVEL
jgi:hypothetical protein